MDQQDQPNGGGLEAHANSQPALTQPEDRPLETASTPTQVSAVQGFHFPESGNANVEAPAGPEPMRPVASSIYPTPGVKPVMPLSEGATQPAQAELKAVDDDRPVPVVKVLSVRGVEYAMMSVLLWFGAGALIITLVSLINGISGFETLAFPISLLLVCLPGFAWFYLRLRRAELDDPSLRLEPSKRRLTQITQFVAFLTCFFNLVSLVYALIGMAGGREVEVGKVIGSALVVFVIAGGILFYYWRDEHTLVSRKWR